MVERAKNVRKLWENKISQKDEVTPKMISHTDYTQKF